jgi:hypothetical protein
MKRYFVYMVLILSNIFFACGGGGKGYVLYVTQLVPSVQVYVNAC